MKCYMQNTSITPPCQWKYEWTHSGTHLTGFLDNNHEATKGPRNYTLSYLHHREVKTKVPLLIAVSYGRKRKEKQEKWTP